VGDFAPFNRPQFMYASRSVDPARPFYCPCPRFTGPPMDLANMRSLGVTRVDVYCGCGHQASVDVSALPDRLARGGWMLVDLSSSLWSAMRLAIPIACRFRISLASWLRRELGRRPPPILVGFKTSLLG
jgi:hypothetical protein